MACKVVENAKPKCECYWPDKDTSRDFSGITVTTVSRHLHVVIVIVHDIMYMFVLYNIA